MSRSGWVLLGVLVVSIGARAGAGDAIDRRLGDARHLRSYFPMSVPKDLDEWKLRHQALREQVLVGTGLWPMPTKTSLNAVVHGKVQKDGYTVEKVFFASYPGHYVSGNLYRPAAGGKPAKSPGVLCPHGHWANGRFYQVSDKAAADQIKQGAEQTMEGARYFLQARCVQLARMGCVVFHYDMVGNADSRQIPHRQGFTDVEAELRLQNFMGLQTYNSIRALDFLLGLPDVDPSRIAVTGASGGGTQTFMLCAVDDRPRVAVPAVMVSTGMQGGCICENCSYLRIDAGNIDLAALWAPRPLGLIGADDWTIEIETKGYPELKEVYALFGKPDFVQAKAFTQFKHNYNQVSREFMYNFMNQHLKLGFPVPVREQRFEPIPPKELSVYDAEHPLPKDAVDAEGLRRWMTTDAETQLWALTPKDARSLIHFQETLKIALRGMITNSALDPSKIEVVSKTEKASGDVQQFDFILSRKDAGERVPVVALAGKGYDGRMVVWVHPQGQRSLWQDGKLVPAARQIIDAGAGIAAVDVLRTGANTGGKEYAVDQKFAGYTFGYNRPLLAERVRDILTAVGFVQSKNVKSIDLVGFDKAGPWVVLARGMAGDVVRRTAADLNQFRFEQVKSTSDEMMLPGALKYGGLVTLAGACAPAELYLHNVKGTGSAALLQAAYQASAAPKNLQLLEPQSSPAAVAEWLLR